MATKFMETPDALNGVTGNTQTSFWGTKTGTVTYDTTQKKSGVGSWKCDAGASNVSSNLGSPLAAVADAGSRASVWMYFTSVSGTAPILQVSTSTPTAIWSVQFSGSKLQIVSGAVTKTGSTTVTTNTWHRISVAQVITTTSNYTIKVWLDGNLEATMTNADGTLAGSSSSEIFFGCVGTGFGTSQQCYFQHAYTDDSSALTDVGDIRTTAKRPNANGTSNQFTVQVGAGSSGYGTGHSSQVNERPVSATNGWQAPVTSGTKTEGYAIESVSTGDVDFSANTQVAYIGWVFANTTGSGAGPTNHILLNGVSTSTSFGASPTLKSVTVDSATYPVTAEVIGVDHTGTGKATQLTECGIMFAYKVAGTTTSTRTIPATAALKGTYTRTIASTVALKGTYTRTIPATSTLKGTYTRQVVGTAAIKGTYSRQVVATSALKGTYSRTIPATAALVGSGTTTGTRQIAATAALTGTYSRPMGSQAALTGTYTRSVPVTAALKMANIQRHIASTAALKMVNIPRPIPATTALLGTYTRTIPATSTLKGTYSRAIPATSALLATNTRSVPAHVALKATGITRQIPGSAAIYSTHTRSIPSLSVLVRTSMRGVPATGALLRTSTRAMPSSVVLAASETRHIPCTVSLVLGRSIVCTAALLRTSMRGVPAFAALYLPNALVYVHSGQSLAHVPGGEAEAQVGSGTASSFVQSGTASASVRSGEATVHVN